MMLEVSTVFRDLGIVYIGFAQLSPYCEIGGFNESKSKISL